MKSVTIRPKGGKFVLTVSADGHIRNYQYSTFVGAYKRLQKLCSSLELEESTIEKEIKGVVL